MKQADSPVNEGPESKLMKTEGCCSGSETKRADSPQGLKDELVLILIKGQWIFYWVVAHGAKA